MADLTAQQAQDMIYRSMLTGVPTSEFDAAGGYDKVYSLAKSAGGNMGAPSEAAIQQYAPQIAQQGYGNMSYAPGGANNPTGGQSSLQKQMAELQAKYDTLVKNGSTPSTGIMSGTTSGGATVNAGGSTATPSNTGGTTGVVYGPDGAMYSSAAAAIAAGVKNFTTTKPVVQSSGGLISPAGVPGTAAGGFMLDAAQTGNANPGGLISGANQQLFKNKVGVQMPPSY